MLDWMTLQSSLLTRFDFLFLKIKLNHPILPYKVQISQVKNHQFGP